MQCVICDEELDSNSVRYAYHDPYCEDCFDDRYDYCFECCRIINLSNNDWYDDDDNRICSSCYNKRTNGPKYPINPNVNDSDRTEVLKLAKQYVQTLGADKFTLRTKPGDYRMKEIAEAVGKISKPIYLFGIKDEKNYRILATQDILGLVVNYFEDKAHIVDRKDIVQNKGYLRLGLDRALRAVHFDKCVELIKYINANKHVMKKVTARVVRAHTNDPEIISDPMTANNETEYEQLTIELARNERATITGSELLILMRTELGRIEDIGERRYRDRTTDAIYTYIPGNLQDEYRVEQPESVRSDIEDFTRLWTPVDSSTIAATVITTEREV